jgi:SAM-dependent methyltransferase
LEFDKFARNYESIHDENVKISGEESVYFSEYKARYLAAHLPANFSGKILDYGCGIGRLMFFIRKYFPAASLCGYDPSHESLQKASQSLPSDMVLMESPSKLDSDYDVIILANVLHHVEPSKRAELIAELAGRLKVGGAIYFFEHNPLNPVTRWVVSQCEFDSDAILLHPSELRGYLQIPSMSTPDCDYVMFFPKFLARLRPVEKSLHWLPLGAQYVVKADKLK